MFTIEPKSHTGPIIDTTESTDPVCTTHQTWNIQNMVNKEKQLKAIYGYLTNLNNRWNRTYYIIRIIQADTVVSEHLQHIITHDVDEDAIQFSKTALTATKVVPPGKICRISKISTFYWINNEYDVYQWVFEAINFDVFSIALQSIRSLPYGEVISYSTYRIPRWLVSAVLTQNSSNESMYITIKFTTTTNTLEITIQDLFFTQQVAVCASWDENYKLIINLHKINQSITLKGFTAFNL